MRASRLMAVLATISLALGLVTITLAAASPPATPTPISEPHSLITLGHLQPPPLAQPTKPSLTSPAPFPSRWSQPIPYDRNSDGAGPNGPGQNFAPHRPIAGGEWDGSAIDQPRVISDTGQYRMWYTGRNPAGNWKLGLAESGDGFSWTKHISSPVLGPGNAGEWDDWYRGQSAHLNEGGLYKMWYSGGGTSGPWQTGYATSTNGLDWNIYPGNPVLPAGGIGSWEEGESDAPTVINDGGTYKMWYHGCNADYSLCSIGHATSPDGINWTKYAGNPVLTGTVGAWDESWVAWPTVIKDGGIYQLWYQSNGQIGLSTSPDGINWTKYAGNPVLSQSWDGSAIRGFTVLRDGGLYRMWLANTPWFGRSIGYAESSSGITWTMPVSNPVLSPGDAGVYVDVNYAHEWVEAWTSPNATLVITVADAGGVKATVTGQADGNGWFGSHQWAWNPGQPDIAPGDTVSATEGATTTVVDPIGTIEGTLDADADIITGTIDAPWFDPLTLTVRCEVWVENGPPPIEVSGVAADGGSYACDFSGVWDIERGQDVAVRYIEPDGDTVINMFYQYPLDINLRINPAHDWVEGFYEPGHTLWLTLTNGLGDLKATATLTTGVVPWWGNMTGFTTGFTVVAGWSPQPDVQEGDWVYVQIDNGYTAAARVGTITGELSVGADTISGTVTASWFTQTLDARCEVWVPGGPGYAFTVDPNGGGYVCDFTSTWDIVPGQDVAVTYVEPDGDEVINIFREPVPHLKIQTWADASPATGGNFPLLVQYWNDGGAPAEDVVITSTLTNTIYITDTTGVGHTGSGSGPIVWALGDIPPYSTGQFVVFVNVTGAPLATLENTVDIATSNPYNEGDPSERTSTWSGEIVANNTQLNVGKWPWTWEPAPGYDYVYTVNVCNNGSTGSSEVTLTDTLPLSTTLVSWWGRQPGWVEVSSAPGELVVSRPSIAGNWCGEVYMRVNLDSNAQPGQMISNTAVITASNDPDPGDNTTTIEHSVGSLRHNLSLDFSWGHGQLVPGSESNYWINVNNSGNLPVTGNIRITETLPVSTTFVRSVRMDGLGQQATFTPTLVTADEVVWEINGLDNGYNDNFMVTLRIDNAAQAGTELLNCVVISDGQFEDNPYDDADCVTETVFAPGPNLRVTKSYNWQGPDATGYEVGIQNVGTVQVNDVSITDTFPATFSLNYWGLDFWEPWSGGVTGNQITATLSRLSPGWTTWLHVGLGFNVPNGTFFTNTAQITLPPGDTNPADNTAVVPLGAGPDLRVDKTLTAGEPRPGELLTFTLHFENYSPWWTVGGVIITDTLPAGLEFVSSQLRLCGPVYFCDRPPDRISGNALGWDWNGVDPIGSWWWDDLVVTVRLTDTLAAGITFTNTVQISSSDPTSDLEPNYANNSDWYLVEMILNRLYLPLLRR